MKNYLLLSLAISGLVEANDKFPIRKVIYTCYEAAAFSIGENGSTDKISPTRDPYYLDMRSWRSPTFGLTSYGLTPNKTKIISSSLRSWGDWVGAYSIETPYNPEILTILYDKEKITLSAVVTTAQGIGGDHYTRNSFYHCGND